MENGQSIFVGNIKEGLVKAQLQLFYMTILD